MPLFKKFDKQTLLRHLKEGDYKDDEEKENFLAMLKDLGDVDPVDVLWMVGCEDLDLQGFAQDVCIKAKDPTRLLRLLFKEMENSDKTGRQNIARLIGKLELPRLKFHLSKMIQSEDVDEQTVVMEILANHPKWQNYMSIVKMALRDSRAMIRCLAVVRLSSAATEEMVFMILRKMCDDPAEIVRHEVLRIMAELDTPDVVEPFFERLPHESLSVQDMIIKALVRLSKRWEFQIENRIFPALLNEEEMVRNAATELLREILRERPDKAEVLRKFFLYTRGVVFWLRERSFEFIKRLDLDVVEPLISLMDDPEDDIRILAMLLAADIKDERIIPVVKKLLVNEKEWWLRVSCVDILSQFKSPEITDFLLKFIDDPDLKWSIIAFLGKREDSRATEYLLKNLKDTRPSIRMVTLNAIEQSLTPGLLNELKAAYERDPVQDVREKAFQFIKELANRGDEEAIEIVKERHQRGLKFLEGESEEESLLLEMENSELKPSIEPELPLMG